LPIENIVRPKGLICRAIEHASYCDIDDSYVLGFHSALNKRRCRPSAGKIWGRPHIAVRVRIFLQICSTLTFWCFELKISMPQFLLTFTPILGFLRFCFERPYGDTVNRTAA